MASSTEIIDVLFRIENPDVFDRIEKLKDLDFKVNIKGNIDKGIERILGIDEHKIVITGDTTSILNSLKSVETSLKSLTGLKEINLKLTGDPLVTLDRVYKKIQEINAIQLAPQLSKLGYIQNNNPKTFTGSNNAKDAALVEAAGLKYVEAAQKNLNQPRVITVEQQRVARNNQPTIGNTNEFTSPRNSGQFPNTQVSTYGSETTLSVNQINARRQEDILKKQIAVQQAALEQQNAEAKSAFDSAFENIISENSSIKHISPEAFSSPGTSVLGRGVSERQVLARTSEDDLIEKQAKDNAAARALEIQRRNSFLKDLQLNNPVAKGTTQADLEPEARFGGVRTPLSKINALTAFDNKVEAQKDFERGVELAQGQNREAAIEAYRKSVDSVPGKPQGRFSPVDINERRADLLKEVGQSTLLGALQGQGALPLAGSALGSIAGAGLGGAAGAALGGALGGAAGVAVDQALHVFADILHQAADAGLSFETSILGISSVLQATTRVTGPGGQAVGIGEQLNFQQGEARSIQKLARQKLLPLGISGEKESTLVQSIISGASQRGIQLTPEQAATLAERLGGTIQAQRPELLNNTGQLRRDIEDLFSGAPNNTVLKTLVKGFAPGLGKATSGDDLIKRSEGLSSFPESLKGSTSNPVVASQKFNSAKDQLFTSFGDALDLALIPGINALTKSLSNPDLLSGVEKVGAAFGTLGSVLGVTAGLISDYVGGIAKGAKSLAGYGTLGLSAVTGNGKGPNQELARLQALKDIGVTDGIDAKIAAQQKIVDAQNKKLQSKPTAAVEIKALLEGTGITSLTESASPDLKSGIALLTALGQVKEKLPQLNKEREDDARAKNKSNGKGDKLTEDQITGFKSESIDQKLSNAIDSITGIKKAGSDFTSLLNTSSPLGELNKLQANAVITSEVSKKAEESLDLAKQSRSLLKPDAKQEDINQANLLVRDTTYELIKARNDERDAINAVKEAEINRSKALRDSKFDPGTQQGRAGLIQSGLEDANSRIFKSTSDIARFNDQLSQTSNPTDADNLRSRIEQAKLEFNKGQVGRAQLSREAQVSAIDLAQGPAEAQKALADFARATHDAADKFSSLADQIEKSQEALKDFEDSKKLRELGREGTIIDAAEKALKATEGREETDVFDNKTTTPGKFSERSQIESDIPPELRDLVKGSFFFNQNSRDQFEANKGVKEFEDVTRRNSPERFAASEVRTQGELFRGVDSAQRAFDALPGEEIVRKFSGLRQLVGLQQQGVDVGDNGREFIAKQAKDLGVDLPKLQAAETMSAELPSNVSSINDSVKSILNLLQGGKGESEDKKPISDKTADSILDGIPGARTSKQRGDASSLINKKGVSLDDIKDDIAKEQKKNPIKDALKFFGPTVLDSFSGSPFFKPSEALKGVFNDEEEPTAEVTQGILDNPINSGSVIAQLPKPERRTGTGSLLREGLGDLGKQNSAKSNAVIEDVVGGFLDADIDGIKKKNNAPVKGLQDQGKGLFGYTQADLGKDNGKDITQLADKIDENFSKLGDIITKAIGGIL